MRPIGLTEMKLLCICQAMDLGIQDIGVTPAWWQIMKAFHQIGVEVLAVPYFGRHVHSLWWKALANPNGLKSRIYEAFETSMAKLPTYGGKREFRKRHALLLASLARKTAAPKWKRFLKNVIVSERDLNAVLLFNVPLNQFVGVSKTIQGQYGVPVVAYDGDLPTSLPRHGGISSSPYVDAQLNEYDAVITNSKGVVGDLVEMGAQKVFTVYYGADPDVFCPISDIDQDVDVGFYGVGSAFREKAIKYMVEEASNLLPHRKFLVSGFGFKTPLGRAKEGKIPYRELISRSRVNLNIVREPHAKAYASSSSRPFELASMGACMVSNEYSGLEEWFEVDREVFVARDCSEAVRLYEWLIENDSVRTQTGVAARDRVMRQHTYVHRAKEILGIIKSLR